MKQYIWMVKVWDLLHTLWWVDTITFSDMFVHNLTTINEPWISWTLTLETLNSTSIQVTIDTLTCSVKDISDISWEEYNRDVHVQDYTFLCSLPLERDNIDEIYDSYEDVYEIDPHNLMVDMENCIINAIQSQEPIVKIKNDESLSDWWIEIVDIPPI